MSAREDIEASFVSGNHQVKQWLSPAKIQTPKDTAAHISEMTV